MPFAPAGSATWPIKKTPSYKTIIQTPASNRGEARFSLTPWPIWLFEYDFSYLKGDIGVASSALQNLVGFFGAVQGSFASWLFMDKWDNAVTQAYFGTGDGSTTVFQLSRNIAGMTDVIQNISGIPALFANGAAIATSAYSISSTGVVTFTSAPAAGAVLQWTGNFFFRCRFEEDDLADLDEFMYQLWELKSLKFRSIIL